MPPAWPFARALNPLPPDEAFYEVLRRAYASTASKLGAGWPIADAWTPDRWPHWLLADFLDRPVVALATGMLLDQLVADVTTPAELAAKLNIARARLPEILKAAERGAHDPDRFLVVELLGKDRRPLLVYAADVDTWRAYAVGRPWRASIGYFSVTRHPTRDTAEAAAAEVAADRSPAMQPPA